MEIMASWIEGGLGCIQIRINEGTEEKQDFHEYIGRSVLVDREGSLKQIEKLKEDMINDALQVRENLSPIKVLQI